VYLRLSRNVVFRNTHNTLAAQSETICFPRNGGQFSMTNKQWTLRTMSARATTLNRFIHTNSFQSSSTVLHNSLSKLHIVCKASVAMTVINPHLRNSSHFLRKTNDLFF